jgi:transaldolase
MADPLADLTAAGVSVWLDDLSRPRLASGTLHRLIQERHVVGVTSNPTIFANAVGRSEAYGQQVRDLAQRGVTVGEAVRMVTTFDVRWACDILRPVYDATGGVDGRVSIEVDPALAQHTESTVAEARQLWWLVDRPNLFIKIPATEAGLPAITQCLAEGISVNVTLIFSLQRYAAVSDAYLAGIERALASGHDLSTLASVASFFVSRVDTEIDHRLDVIGSPKAKTLRGKAGIANARLAYQLYATALATDRAQTLLAAGAHPQRPLWASTGVKNPSYSDTMYVTELVAPDVVNTMPQATLDAVAAHAVIRGDTVRAAYPEAQQVLDDLTAVGVDYDDVVRMLEEQGVATFEDSWARVASQLAQHMPADPDPPRRQGALPSPHPVDQEVRS